MPHTWVPLSQSPMRTPRARRAFTQLAATLAASRAEAGRDAIAALDGALRLRDPGVSAAANVLFDLFGQGWEVRLDGSDRIEVQAPVAEAEADAEKDRV